MDLINPKAQKYAEKYSRQEDDLLNEIETQTMRDHPEAHMLSGALQGKFLEMISCLRLKVWCVETQRIVGVHDL